MANRYIRQSIEREMILVGIEEVDVSSFINFAVEEALSRERRHTKIDSQKGYHGI